MRPRRVEMEGFSAFRSRTVVDFTDAELFAFVGPTGAGKSSVIDGMIFALYGSVPRYGSDRLVHPVITQGKPEARVQLDFELAGQRYTAVRVVRRTKAGATTKEARLQRGDEVLAADARGVTEAVTDLLGLDLEQFTKCVVLPQGAFAALLHDTSAKRQDLLVKLLDLGVYEQVAAAARRRVQEADQRLAVLDGQLHQLADATEEAVAAAEARVAAVRAAVEAVEQAAPTLALLDERVRRADDELAGRRQQLAAVAGIAVPGDVASVAEALRAAEQELEAAEADERSAVVAVEQATATREPLGDPAALRDLQRAHQEVDVLAGRVEKGQASVESQEAQVAPRREAEQAAAAAVAAAEAALERARVEHAAADLARHLHEGDDCPVCGSTVTTLPEVDARALAAAEEALAGARRAHGAAAQDAADAATTLATYEAKLDDLVEQLDVRRAQVADAPPVAELEHRLAAIDEADRAVAAARDADARARRRAAAARQARADAAATEARARAELARARDLVAAQGPPALGDDLAADWDQLVRWCGERARALEDEIAGVEQDATAARAERTEVLSGLADAARRAGVPVAAGAPSADQLRDACVRAEAEAAAAHRRLVDDRGRVAALRDEQVAVADQRSVHEALVAELHPKRFEAWLLEEALGALVEGASARLEQLSSGRYAMALDDKQTFEVIDHANADERRLARTLSGGETFLASLALALALAERVSELSPAGHTSLDAIFLDEGFGTLDPETLDVVASAIEELGASGRMVGVVSHVRELAERVPTRYEVRRGPESSTVERVDA
ncbi:MAG TPA: SMC family ATPase [Acidimicrobiales bacterium]|nr:SMC family ATPase [Acidimicrobiales bacterium]